MPAFAHAALRWFSSLLPILVVLARPTAGAAQIVPQDVNGLEITPDAGYLIVAPNTSGHQLEFWATNGGSTGGTWTFSCSRTGNVTCGAVVPTSRTLAAGGGGEVSVTFNAQGGGTGRITLTASPGGETGYVDVDVAEPGPPTVTLNNHNGDNVDRSLCLTSGAGDGAAWSCGDLVISHAMPGYTTMNRQRSLTLIHNSGTANPRPAIAAVVSQAGRTLMDTVFAELWLGSPLIRKDSAGYKGWSTGIGSSRQVVLDFNADALPTGAYPIELRVRNGYNGVGNYPALLPARDTLLIVNRSSSEFGAGFGIAGLEQLYINQPVGTQHILWVGGDGSAKLYRTTDGVTWQAAKGGFRETITLSGGVYTRTLRHGVQVKFDAQGRQTSTINRTGQTTTFGWTSTASGLRLTSITVPPTGQGGSYALSYATAAPRSLVTIQDPAARTLSTAIVNGRLNTITDPDGPQTTFGWDASRRITSRRNREGWTTRYEYSKNLSRGSRVTRVTFPIGRTSDTETAFTVFEPWNDKGLAIGPTAQVAETLANVSTRIVGPRDGVTDNATFWIDRWGAPTKIQNPAAAVTTLVRGNTNFPALITRIIHPNGRITDQTYNNTRGNLIQVRDDIAPVVGDPPTRVTEYKYTDLRPKVVDSPTEVWEMVGATARKTIYTYNNEGQPTEVEDPRGHRTSYVYKTTAALKGLLVRSTELNVETWEETTPTPVQDTTFQWRDHERRFDYDAKGNMQADTSAIGAVTSYKRDPKGRVTDVYDPLKTRTQRVYDDLNRVTALKQYTVAVAHPIVTNPLAPCQGNQAVCADNNRNWDSPPNPVNTTYTHGAMHLEAVLDHRLVPRTYDYDTRGLVIGETDDFGKTRLAFYNEAGLIERSVSRTGRAVRFYYDAAGRRTAMAYSNVVSATGDVILGDSIRYGYDVMDNLVTVINREGTITRTYMRNGLVKQKTMDFVGNTPNDVATYGYDETGALRSVARGSDLVRYNYAAATGDLTTMDVILGAPANMTKTFTFQYDSLGRRRTITYPTIGANPMTVKFRYDKAGALRRLISNHPGGLSSNVLTFTYRNVAVDPIGRVIRDSLTCQYTSAHGSACQNAANIRVANDYSRLGALLRQVHRRGSATDVDTMGYDPSGNMKHRKQYDLALTFDHTHAFTLDATNGDPHNRLASFVRSELNNSLKEVQHNFDGARSYEFRSPAVPTAPEDRHYHYDGLGRMTGTAEYVMVGGTPQPSNRPNACQYDGDGQMIGPCDNGSFFLTLDGHNASGTIENGSSSWRFFHGLGVDDPLVGYFRGTVNKLYYWVTDGNGREFAVADSFGRRQSADDAVSHMGDWRYAGGTKASNSFDADRFASPQAPQLSFFRNRAYDQETGRWTQEDPIGLAGGVNLYQFNGNNPVSYSDPFGLCWWCIPVVAGGSVASSPAGQRLAQEVAVGAALVGTALVATGQQLQEGLEAGAQALVRVGKAVRTLLTGLLIGGAAVIPGVPEGGDATQGGSGTRTIPGSEATVGPPVVRPDTATSRPPSSDDPNSEEKK